MLQLIKEIPVTFEPHWADERMLWLTVGSIAVSGILGFLAYWNGRRATLIAQEASTRDERRIKLEQDVKAANERREVAIAMIRALNAVRTLCGTSRVRHISGPNLEANPRHDEASRAADDYESGALALISLLHTAYSPSQLRDWFSHMILHAYGFFGHHEMDADTATSALNTLLSRISAWSSNSGALKEMISTDFEGPLDTNQGADVCQGNHFLQQHK